MSGGVCTGLPHEPSEDDDDFKCPKNARGRSLVNYNNPANLPLCHDCAKAHFAYVIRKQNGLPPRPAPNELPPVQNTATALDNNDDEQAQNNGTDESETIICIENALLAYLLSARDNSQTENIRRAVIGFFSAEAIMEAKQALWDKCEHDIGEPLTRRRDSSSRTECEANFSDVINALKTLDGKGKSPKITIDARDLVNIPRSPPEEINKISIVDRLTQLETHFRKLEDNVENRLINAWKLDNLVNHCNKLERDIQINTGACDVLSTEVGLIKSQIPNSPIVIDNDEEFDDSDFLIPEACNSDADKQNKPAGDHGSLKKCTDNAAAADNIKSYRDALQSKMNTDDDGFELSSFEKRRLAQQLRKSTEKPDSSSTGKFRYSAGPEPFRDVWVARVSHNARAYMIGNDLEDRGIKVINIDRISNQEARYSSYRVTVPASDMKKILSNKQYYFAKDVIVKKYKHRGPHAEGYYHD